MSELALKLIREAKETRATSLDLGNCGLTELPGELFELTWLEELIVTDNWFYSTDENNRKNNIKNIPYNLNKLTKLKKLSVSGLWGSKWQLSDINPIINLLHLQYLDISSTLVSDLSPLKNLVKLEHLSLSSTQVSDLSPLKSLVKLKHLSVSFTQVSDLNPLKSLVKLEHLSLSSTSVYDLSPLKNLIKLEYLTVSSTQVSDLSPLQKLTLLLELNIAYTQVKDLYSLKGLVNLQEFYVHNTNISDLMPLKNLIEIRKLHVQYTQVSDLSPLKNFINIENLSITSTKVSDLSPLKNLKKLKTFYYNRSPITNPPIEIVKEGLGAIKRYFRQIENQKGTVELYEAKFIIVGEGGTGKTTLFEKLKDNNHSLGNTPETHGINIHEGLTFNHNLVGNNTFHVNLWDFGGQELQYMTHQFFLTPRALYVLMMDARRESPNLAYWFKIISLLGRDSEDSTEKIRLLLVFNKRGNTTGQPPQYQDQLKYYEDSLDVQYCEVDFAENDYRFENLQKTIQQSLVTLPIVKSQLPRLWKVVREDLREEAKTENYITTKRLSEICSKHGITEEDDQWLLSGYLHQLGSLLHFQNDESLIDIVILSPQWAVDGVYTFLKNKTIADEQKGKFSKEDIFNILKEQGYTKADSQKILLMMSKNNFDICYKSDKGDYVAAQLLPDNAPTYKWYPKDVLQFRYQYPIMPKGLMSRLIVRLSDDIERDDESGEQIVWKKGVVLLIKSKEGDCRVRLREDDAESKVGLRQILIEVMGERNARKYALRRVRDTVDDLHKKWFRNIKPNEMVPCCCDKCKISDNPKLFPLNDLLELRQESELKQCTTGKMVSIQLLLEGVYNKAEIQEFRENKGKSHFENYHQHRLEP